MISKISRRILMLFFSANLFAQVALFLIPASSQGSNPIKLLVLNMSFVLLVSVFSVCVLIGARRTSSRIFAYDLDDGLLKKNINILIVSPIIGFLLLFYDRVFIRGIDYTAGLRNARYQWLNSAEQGGSIYSVVGNLIIPLSYIAVFFLVFYFKRISLRRKFFLFCSVLCGVLGHSALNGGRSNILLAIIIVIFALTMKPDFRIRFVDFLKPTVLLVIAIVFFYVALIMQSSANLGDITLKHLTKLGVFALYGEVEESFHQTHYNNFVYQIMYAIAYLFHGQWTAEISLSLDQREGSYVFLAFSVLLYKFGLIDQPLKSGYFSDSGAFISLPGAYYYDFGFFGVLICSIVHGVLLGIAMAMLQSSNKIGLIKLAYIMFMFFVTIMSPIVPAYGLVYLLFIMWAFLLLWFMNILFFKKKYVF